MSVDATAKASLSQVTSLAQSLAALTPNSKIVAPYETTDGGSARFLCRVVVVGEGGKAPPVGPQIRSSMDMALLLKPMAMFDVEHYVSCSIDHEYHLRAVYVVGVGGRGSVAAAKREVLKVPLLIGAAAMIGAHNHPTATPRPSVADKRAGAPTERLCGMLGLKYLDDLIIAPEGFYSFADQEAHKWDGTSLRKWSVKPTRRQEQREQEDDREGLARAMLSMTAKEKADFTETLRRMTPSAREAALRNLSELRSGDVYDPPKPPRRR